MTDRHPRVYWTADRSTLVEEGDERAAFLAYAEETPIPPEHLALLGKAPVEAPIAAEVPKPAPVKRRTTRKGA